MNTKKIIKDMYVIGLRNERPMKNKDKVRLINKINPNLGLCSTCKYYHLKCIPNYVDEANYPKYCISWKRKKDVI